MSKQFELTIECDNDAFGNGGRPCAREIARILVATAQRLVTTPLDNGWCKVRDVNGNTVGRFRLVSDL